MELKAYSPQGFPICGTLEQVRGVAEGIVRRLKNGQAEIEYTGSTDLWWDEQRSVMVRGTNEIKFIDEDGNEVRESKIVWKEE